MKTSNNHYNPGLKDNARFLRQNSVSIAEKILWKHVLSRSKTSVRFKRQRPIRHYIVDFFAQEIGLIIEIDGSSHLVKAEYDHIRQNDLEVLGYSIIRFSERDVIKDLDSVRFQILHAIHCLKDKN